jgi:WD40 repeat protein
LPLANEKQIASGESDYLIKIWHMETGRLVTYLAGHTGKVFSLVNSKKGHMASNSEDRSFIKIWNYENKGLVVLLKTFRCRFKIVTSLIPGPDGNLLSADFERKINIWNLKAIYRYPNRSNLIPYQ